MKKRTSGCFLLAVALTAVFLPSPARTAPMLLPGVLLTNFSATVGHSGTSGAPHGVEASLNLASWELLGPSQEVMPGFFRFTDQTAMHHPWRFYRASAGYPGGTYGWMMGYPMSYLDGTEVDPLPRFMWGPYPAPGATYSLEVQEALPDGSGGHAPIPPVLISIAGLGVTSYTASGPTAALPVDRDYLYRVSARVGGVDVRGRWVLIRGHGVTNATFTPTGFLPASGGSGDVRRLLRLSMELMARKEAVRQKLEGNPLVSEARLLEQLLFILQQPDGLIQVAQSILNAQLEALTDPETVLKALCYLDKIVDYALDHDTDLKGARRTALQSFSQSLKDIKEALEDATDRAQQLQQTVEQIGNLIEEMQQLAENPLDYLKNLVTEKLKEKLRSMLARKLTGAAAGAIFSIISDLVAAGDALLALNELEDLCREMNRLLLAAIAADTSAATSWTYSAILPQSYLNCDVTLSFKKMCWKPKPGGGPNDGDWEVSPVPFLGGGASRTVPVSSLITGPGPDGKIRVSFLSEVDPAALTCPPGAGPCILFFQVSYQCPGANVTAGGNFFGRAIKCP